MCFVFLHFCLRWKPLWIPFERYRYGKKRWRSERDIAFRSSDGLPILLRKLPERCKMRPSKSLRNSSSRPFVSKFGRWIYAYSMYLNPKMYRGLSNFCKSYWQTGDVSLPKVTTNEYNFFRILLMLHFLLSDAHIVSYSLYTHTTCIRSALV